MLVPLDSQGKVRITKPPGVIRGGFVLRFRLSHIGKRQAMQAIAFRFPPLSVRLLDESVQGLNQVA